MASKSRDFSLFSISIRPFLSSRRVVTHISRFLFENYLIRVYRVALGVLLETSMPRMLTRVQMNILATQSAVAPTTR